MSLLQQPWWFVSGIVDSCRSMQWRRYTRERWKIHRPGSALPSPAYCFASVIVWTENENVTKDDRFVCAILTVKRRWRPVFWGRQPKKCIRVTWLGDCLTSKGPGVFTALAPPLYQWRVFCRPTPFLAIFSTRCSELNLNLANLWWENFGVTFSDNSVVARAWRAFEVLQGSVETLLRWGGKCLHGF